MEDAPDILALVGYPLAGGHVILTRQTLVSLEDAEMFHRLGFVVLIDPASEQAYHDWRRWAGAWWRQW